MCDRTFFEHTLTNHLQDMGLGVRVEVATYGGERFYVKRIAEAQDGFVILVVHPTEDRPLRRRKFPGTRMQDPLAILEDEYAFGRVALSYSSIVSVRLEPSDPGLEEVSDAGKRIGFEFDEARPRA